MKPLKNFLNPKAQWHPREFPKVPTRESILQYLEDNDIKTTEEPVKTMFDIYNFFESQIDLSYILTDVEDKKETTYSVRIFRGGRITDRNPMYSFEQKGKKIVFCGTETKEANFTNMKYDKFAKTITDMVSLK